MIYDCRPKLIHILNVRTIIIQLSYICRTNFAPKARPGPGPGPLLPPTPATAVHPSGSPSSGPGTGTRASALLCEVRKQMRDQRKRIAKS